MTASPQYVKHKFNIFPEMNPDEFEELKADISINGYDPARPILVYHGGIVDGWNRYRVCQELGVRPTVKPFEGNDLDAINFVMSTNKRRNLTSSQRAAIAVEAEDIVQAIEEAVEKERRAKIAANNQNQYTVGESAMGQLVAPSLKRDESEREKTKVRTKLAETFRTNRQYISDAKRLRQENPEAFERIKAGETTITKVKKEQKKEKRERQREAAVCGILGISGAGPSKISVTPGEWYDLGPHRLYCGSNMDDDFIYNLPRAKFAFADPPYNENVMDWDSGFSWQQNYLNKVAEIVAVTPGVSQISKFMRDVMMPYKWSMSAWISNGMTRGALGFGNWIYIALFSDLESIHRNAQDFYKVSVKTSESEGHFHKGKKPTELMVKLIQDFTAPEEIVIDPFLGSGTTLFACEELGRVCFAAEKSPEYCQLIIDKYESSYGSN